VDAIIKKTTTGEMKKEFTKGFFIKECEMINPAGVQGKQKT